MLAPLGRCVLTTSLGSLRQREAEEGLGDGPHRLHTARIHPSWEPGAATVSSAAPEPGLEGGSWSLGMGAGDHPPGSMACSPSAVAAAPAVPEGAHHERLEPAPWEPQDARGPHVPVRDHS